MKIFQKIAQIRASSNQAMHVFSPPTVSMTVAGQNDEEVIQSKFLPSNTSALENFAQYCINEFSIENLIGYAAVSATKKAPTETKMMLIYNSLLSRSSPIELNVPKATIASFNSAMTRPAILNNTGFTTGRQRSATNRPDLIKSLQLLEDQIMINLLDTYSRYKIPSTSEGNIHKFVYAARSTSMDPGARQLIRTLHMGGITMPQALLSL